MIKLGVYRPSQYRHTRTGPGLWSHRTRLAYRLLRTSIPPSREEIEMFEGIMHHVHLSEGVYRTTARQRFQTLDAFVLPLLETHFPTARFSAQNPLRVEDWAASACITSVEWFESLQRSYPNGAFSLTASDLHLFLVEIELADGSSYVVEASGQPLQYVKAPFVIPLNRKESSLLPLNLWIQGRAQKNFAQLQQQGVLKAVALDEGREEWKQGTWTFRKIPLIHPEALALHHSTPAFQIDSHSIFDVLTKPCHVIRTMNILNLSYFDRNRLLEGIGTVWRSLEPDGLWLVGRTHQERKEETPAVHRATLFAKTPTGFRVVDRQGAPSEVEDLTLAFSA